MDDEEDVFIDIGYRQNTPEQNYILREVRLKDVQDKTMAEIYKMLEDSDEDSRNIRIGSGMDNS